MCERGLSWQQTFFVRVTKLVSGSLVLLAPEGTVVTIALSLWSHRRVPRHKSTRAPYLCRWIPPGRSFQKSPSSGSRQGRWAHNLWEDGVSPGNNTPHWAKAQRLFPLALLSWKKESRAEYR